MVPGVIPNVTLLISLKDKTLFKSSMTGKSFGRFWWGGSLLWKERLQDRDWWGKCVR